VGPLAGRLASRVRWPGTWPRQRSGLSLSPGRVCHVVCGVLSMSSRHWPITRFWVIPRPNLPPPLRGWIGGMEVLLYVWPPSVPDAPHPDAHRQSSGTLAGYWLLVRVD